LVRSFGVAGFEGRSVYEIGADPLGQPTAVEQKAHGQEQDGDYLAGNQRRRAATTRRAEKQESSLHAVWRLICF